MNLRQNDSRMSSVSRETESRIGAYVRKEKLMSKLLARVVSELQMRKIQPTPQLVDEAHKLLDERFQPQQSMSDKDMHEIVSIIIKKKKTQSKPPTPSPADMKPQERLPTPLSEAPSRMDSTEVSVNRSESAVESVKRARDLLKNTSKKQRQILADAKWAEAAEEDRVAGIEGKKNDRKSQVGVMMKQKDILDHQMDEFRAEQERQHQEKLRMQREMDDHIKNHQYLSRKEREDGFAKAMKEKKFREDQQKENERLREEARTKEHNDQVRHAMMVRQELEKQRQSDLDRKGKEKEEWKRMVQANVDRLDEKQRDKERQQEEDRLFQKEYSDRLAKQEKDRAETKARKAARATYFQQLADGVASMFMAKEQDLSTKIESEYQEQLRRAMEDENRRKAKAHERTMDCQKAIRDQLAAKKRQEEQDKEDERRLANQMRQQAQEAQHQEECRRLAARAEANRLKEFLNTQLQMSHFKETQEPQTSIARPESRCKTMYSPSRYQPSPKPDMILEMDGQKKNIGKLSK